MGQEIEAKIKVEAMEPVAHQLGRLGARFAAERVQSDAYFSDADGALKKRGCGLRLRTETAGGQTIFILTFKGPRQESPYKNRPECQTQVVDGAAAAAILEALGYRTTLTVAKTRRVWELDGCEVCLDELPRLGCFVEVEGPDEQTILKVLTKLGLQDQPHIRHSYSSMMARQLESEDGSPNDVLTADRNKS
ncbi:MAG: class IV adenylate cyclase [Planctomycetales bacterium]|nr:class IV adenylate cyclase [Planctomycetales bacterium]